MTGLAVKSLWARRVRALTTTLAVVIGVAFVAGTYILTDTTFAAFDEIFADSLAKTDVVITAKDAVRQETGEVPELQRLPAAEGEAGPGGPARVGPDLHPGCLLRCRERADRLQVRAEVHHLRPARGARNADLCRGPPAAQRLPGLARRGCRRRGGARARRHAQTRLGRTRRLLPRGRLDQARRGLLGRRQHRRADPARGAADHRQARRIRPDRDRRRRGRLRRDAEAPHPADRPPVGSGGDRQSKTPNATRIRSATTSASCGSRC